MTATRPARPLALLVFVGLVLAFGTMWPAMQVAVEEMPVLAFRAVAGVIASTCLFSAALLAGKSLRIPRGQAGPLVVAALFNVTGWQLFSAWGVSELPAGRASLIAYTLPVWTFLFSIPLLGERFTAWRFAGLALALAGVAVMMGDDVVRLGDAPVGVGAILAASVCFSFGTVWQKRVVWRMPHLSLTAWQSFIGVVPIVLLALPQLLELEMPGSRGVIAVAYGTLVGQVFGVASYLWLVSALPVKTLSLSVLLVPLVGLTSSALLLDEPVSPILIVAAALIFAAIGTSFRR